MYKIEHIISDKDSALILGKNGKTLDTLITESGCDVALRPVINGSRIVVIIGEEYKCKIAKKMLMDVLRQGSKGKRQFKIPSHVVGHVIGKRGSTIKEIKQYTNCQISLTEGEDGEYTCCLQGGSEEMEYANTLIQQAMKKAEEFSN